MYALVDVNNFYASCERLFRPDLAHKPIIVLSNNDGCVIARSNEARALGIKMAMPYFQVKDICQMHDVQVFSSNYTLYGDLSQRVMGVIESCCPDMEVYSIDEAFLDLRGFAPQDIEFVCQAMVEKVKKWVGLPVSVGIGPTKTLAKLANFVAKRKLNQPVFNLASPIEQMKWLTQIPVDEVWGVGRKLSKRLERMGVQTAMQLRLSSVSTLRKQFSVMLERTARELNGQPCQGLEEAEPRQAIMSSKSFGQKQTALWPMAEALSSYCARACEKLRKQGSVAGFLQVFLRTSPHHPNPNQRYSNAVGMNLINPTDDTRAIIKQAKRCLQEIYKEGFAYQKVGVLLSDLTPKGEAQGDLFSFGQDDGNPKGDRLMQVMAQVHQKYGRDALRIGAEGLKQEWKLKSSNCSPCCTTRWQDLPKVS